MKEIKKNFNSFVNKLNEANDFAEKIRPAIEAMESGIDTDYRLKE